MDLGAIIDSDIFRVHHQFLCEIVCELNHFSCAVVYNHVIILTATIAQYSWHKLIYACMYHIVHPTDKKFGLEINFDTTEYIWSCSGETIQTGLQLPIVS